MTLTIAAVSNPVYSKADNSTIDCVIVCELGTHPFTAAADDSEAYGVTLFNELVAGQYGAIAPYVAPVLTPAQQAATALAAGLTLTCTSTPALNGTYAIDTGTQAQINAVVTYTLVKNAFPAGVTELPWVDISGAVHLFPTVALFQEFAAAVANFVAGVNFFAQGAASLPSNAITIP